MKFKVTVLATVVWLAAGLALPAAKTPPRPFFMAQPVTMEGQTIAQGMYQLKLADGKSSVQVELWKGGQLVASWHGAWVKSAVKYKENAVLLRVNPDGSRSLMEIRLAGVSKTIVLDNQGAHTRLNAE